MNFIKSLRKLWCVRDAPDPEPSLQLNPPEPLAETQTTQVNQAPVDTARLPISPQTLRRIPTFLGSLREAASRSGSPASSKSAHSATPSTTSNTTDAAITTKGGPDFPGLTSLEIQAQIYYPVTAMQNPKLTVRGLWLPTSWTADVDAGISHHSSADSFHTAASTPVCKSKPLSLKRVAKKRDLRGRRESGSS